MKAPEDRSVPHSISCTPLQWMRMQDLAKRAGRPTSPYVVDRVLKRDELGGGEGGHALVLDEEEQREMHDAAVRADAALSQLSGLSDEASPGLAALVGMLFEARHDGLARAGRGDELQSLLASIAGPERAATIVGRVVERIRREG